MSVRHFFLCFLIISILQVFVLAQQDSNSTKTKEEAARNGKGNVYFSRLCYWQNYSTPGACTIKLFTAVIVAVS